VVTHGQTFQTFDFAPRSGEKDVFQFAAFYGDCRHEVKRVTRGNRVTLTYQIEREWPTPEYGSDDEARYWAVRTRVFTWLRYSFPLRQEYLMLGDRK
jgi:hypothetical protein